MTDIIAKGYLVAAERERNRTRLDDALALIRDDWRKAHLPQVHDAPVRRTVPDSKPPLDIAQASVLDGCERALRYWTRLVIRERAQTRGPRGLDGRRLAEYLSLHSEWLAAHERADEVVRQLERHAQYVHALALGSRMSFVDVGACPERHRVDDVDLGPCDGRLTAIIRKADNGMLPDRIVCSHDSEHTWAPWQWPNLGRRLVGELDPEGVARLMRQLRIKHSSDGAA